MPDTSGPISSSPSCAGRPKSSKLVAPHDCRHASPREGAGLYLVGLSDVGRTTIRVLCINSDEQLELRMAGE